MPGVTFTVDMERQQGAHAAEIASPGSQVGLQERRQTMFYPRFENANCQRRNPTNKATSKNPNEVGAIKALLARRVTIADPRGVEESFAPNRDVRIVPHLLSNAPTLLYALHELREAN
jgi:hypothetical protein